jgi:hypothetical protein
VRLKRGQGMLDSHDKAFLRAYGVLVRPNFQQTLLDPAGPRWQITGECSYRNIRQHSLAPSTLARTFQEWHVFCSECSCGNI